MLKNPFKISNIWNTKQISNKRINSLIYKYVCNCNFNVFHIKKTFLDKTKHQ